MKPILLVKTGIDIVMTALLLVVMGHHITENLAHEAIGITIFVLFIVHHILNYKWYKNLFKGKYTPARIFQTTIDFLLFICILLLIVSAPMVSMDVLAFLNIGGAAVGRILHRLCGIWSFIFMAIHLGFHVPMFIGMAKKAVRLSPMGNTLLKWILRLVLFAVCAYGIYAFTSRALWDDMFYLTEFQFMPSETAVAFFSQYIALFVLFAAIGYYVRSALSEIYAQYHIAKAERRKVVSIEESNL